MRWIPGLLSAVVAVALCAPVERAPRDYRIGVLQAADTRSARRAGDLQELLESGRHAVRRVSCDRLRASGPFDLLVRPCGTTLPGSSIPLLQDHLRRGGDLLALGAPAFTGRLWKGDGRWASPTDLREWTSEGGRQRVLFDFDEGDLEGWSKGHSGSDRPAALELTEGVRGRALRVNVHALQKWNTVAAPIGEQPFPEGHTLTCLYARAGGQTRRLSLEWREKDGSRWVAVFPVGEQWRRVVLTPDDFNYWSGGPKGRGGPEDTFNPPDATYLSLGLSRAPAGSQKGGHRYDVDEIATAPPPFPEARRALPPPVPGLTAQFFYDVTGAARLESAAGRLPLPASKRVQSHVCRRNTPRTRWLALADASDADGKWVATPAGMQVDFAGPTRGSARAAFSVEDADWYGRERVRRLIASTVDRMARGVFLRDTGGPAPRHRPGDTVRVAIEVANLSRRPTGSLTVRLRLSPQDGPGPPVVDVERTVEVGPGERAAVSREVSLPGRSGLYRFEVRLLDGSEVIDRLERKVRVARDAGRPEEFLGFGTEWDPYYSSHRGEWSLYSEISEEDWRRIESRIEFMKLPLVRMMMLVRWCYREDGTFDWQSEPMKHLYRQLDVCQRNGIDVILADWGCESWTTAPGISAVEDPTYAKAIGAYMEHLIEDKGYSCIKYFVLVNEPNLEVRGGWDDWKNGVRNVSRELERRGLGDCVTFLGPDAAQGPMDWHGRAVDELPDVLEGYDIHLYARAEMVRRGGLGAFFHRRWDYARHNDPAGGTKFCVLGEAGLINGSASHNDHIDTYGYGLAIADYAVQAVRADSAAVSAWMLDDNSHRGFRWGMWSSSQKGLKLRPWFYTWSLLTRFFPPGSIIYRPEEPDGSVRLLAARLPHDGWSFCVVNRGDEPMDASIDAPGEGSVSLNRYLYSQGRRPADEHGFPVPVGTVQVDLSGEFGINCPPQSVVILTTRAR